MKDEARIKVLDVMHTLSVIRDGKAVQPQISAGACWKVLEEVLRIEAELGEGS